MQQKEHIIVFLIAFSFSVVLGPILIPFLRKLKFGQTVRDDGPKTHFVKTGTPTIGGLIFLVPIFVISLVLFFFEQFRQVLPLAFVTVGFGLIGFIDDYLKVVKKSKDGLFWYQKMTGLIIVAILFSVYVRYFTNVGTEIIIPFTNQAVKFDISWAFIPFCLLVLIATTNAVNITDGLDGLAAGTSLIVMVCFTIIAMTNQEWTYAKMFSAVVAGGCLGFLVFNLYPAKVFMGDTGSLALGGAIASTAIMMKLPLFIVIVGLIFVIEALSVILQVVSFKTRGKRIFKMAPLHHHFELSGWKETKVVYVFWFVTFIMAVICLFSLGVRFK